MRSPSFIVLRACQVARSMPSVMKCTDPSAKHAFPPPVWRLRAVYCCPLVPFCVAQGSDGSGFGLGHDSRYSTADELGVLMAMNQDPPWSLNTSPRVSRVSSVGGNRVSDMSSVLDVPSDMSVRRDWDGTDWLNPPEDVHPNGALWAPGLYSSWGP